MNQNAQSFKERVLKYIINRIIISGETYFVEDMMGASADSWYYMEFKTPFYIPGYSDPAKYVTIRLSYVELDDDSDRDDESLTETKYDYPDVLESARVVPCVYSDSDSDFDEGTLYLASLDIDTLTKILINCNEIICYENNKLII